MPTPSSRTCNSICLGARQLARGYPEIAPVRHRVNGVDHQGQRHLFDLRRIALQRRQAPVQVHLEHELRSISALCSASRIVRVTTRFKSERLRFIGEVRENDSRLCSSSPHRLLSEAISSSDSMASFLCSSSADAAFNPLFQQLGVGQNSCQGIVDLMRHHGRHLANGDHALHLQDLLLGVLQLAGLLLHPMLQRMRPTCDLALRRLQLAAHAVERPRQRFPVRRRIRPESGSPTRPRQGVWSPPRSRINGACSTVRIAIHTNRPIQAPPPSSSNNHPQAALRQARILALAMTGRCPEFPGCAGYAGWAWQAALEHSGLFRIGAITPSTRCLPAGPAAS